ncbi:MAG: hypothetical protein EA352_11245 [Gemmatimonadales bacterium]|nr:MAG: hypothetical protein EA352_11245 [Gemmatimonadales bacterium]
MIDNGGLPRTPSFSPHARSMTTSARSSRAHRSPGSALLTLAAALLLGLAACQTDDAPPGADADPEMTGDAGAEVRPIAEPDSERIELVPSPQTAPDVPGASLRMDTPTAGQRFAEGEDVEVRLDLEGYDLGVPTPSGDERGLARAPDGQHVHLVLNDEPYDAIYDLSDPIVLEDLPAGTHVLRAFPGRDWHESVKLPGTLAQVTFVVGEGEMEFGQPQEWGPSLIYSRPQATYSGAAADSVLVDFVLSGVDLAPDGYTVELEVLDRVFDIERWAPYLLTNLPSGEITLRMALLDPEGNEVDAPFLPVERTIQVERDDEGNGELDENGS